MTERTVTTSEPWGAQREALQDIYARGRGLMNTPQQYFPGETVAGFAPAQEAAMGLTQARAMGGSPYENAMGQYLTGAMGQGQVGLGSTANNAAFAQRGLYGGMAGLGGLAGAGPNPYLDQMYGAASRGLNRNFNNTVAPALNATFGSGGRTGSMAHQSALNDAGQRLMQQQGDLAANIYGGAYNQDQNRRLSASQSLAGLGMQGIGAMGNIYGQIDQSRARAAGLAPAMQNMEYQNYDRLFGVGTQQRNLAQAQMQDAQNRHQFYQDQPWRNLERYNALVGNRQWGGQQTQSYNPGSPSPWQIAGGIGMLGLGIGSAFAGGGSPGAGG